MIESYFSFLEHLDQFEQQVKNGQKISDGLQLGQKIYFPTQEMNSKEIFLEPLIDTMCKQREAARPR